MSARLRRAWQQQRIALILAAILGLLVVGFLGFGWYVSGSIHNGALEVRHGEPEFHLEVVAVSDTEVTLRGDDSNLERRGLWGLEWRDEDGDATGYAQVGEVIEVAGDGLVRRALVPDSPAPPEGVSARLDNFAFPGDPSTLGLDFQEVTFPAEDGDMPAWYVPGDGTTWAILTHGKGADRREALRILPTLAERGLPALVVTYRNDVEAPSEISQYAYGATEWQDLDAAVRFARSQGAERIVLVGYSMGGGITMGFLERSEDTGLVVAAILDAPMLDLRTIARDELTAAGVPGLTQWWPLWLTAQRFDLDWARTDYLPPRGPLEVPVLLFHGTADDVISVDLSDEFARLYPDQVEYHRIEGAHHVGAWNLDPAGYAEAVGAFLDRVLAEP
ncbi:MAG: lysophospholipase [Dehalococcoidia bacterium]|nr:lysophospholipase [Dehalococcoidia bacterium]